jgi:hypothetical protein
MIVKLAKTPSGVNSYVWCPRNSGIPGIKKITLELFFAKRVHCPGENAEDRPKNNFPAAEGDSPIFVVTKIGTVPHPSVIP